MNQKVDNSTISTFDLDRYLGKWYEIARYDHSFERGLVGNTAMYTLRDDGKIKVLNSGYINTLDGPYKESVGKARARKNGIGSKFLRSLLWRLRHPRTGSRLLLFRGRQQQSQVPLDSEPYPTTKYRHKGQDTA